MYHGCESTFVCNLAPMMKSANLMKEGTMFEDILVRDWMTETVYTVLPNTPITAAHKIMKDKKIRRLPVLKFGEVIGIVTLGDVREASPSDATTLSMWELNYLWSQLTVEKIMTTNVFTLRPDEPLLNAAAMMLKYKISGLPVVENKSLVGILTESDIFRMLVLSRHPAVDNTPS
jgi:acetoin utilization protein AcuB